MYDGIFNVKLNVTCKSAISDKGLYKKYTEHKVDDSHYLIDSLKKLSLNGAGGSTFFVEAMSSDGHRQEFNVSWKGLDMIYSEISRQIKLDNQRAQAKNSFR